MPNNIDNMLTSSKYGFTYKDPVLGLHKNSNSVDREWLTEWYVEPLEKFDIERAGELVANRFFTVGDIIFGNTTPGYSRSINPLPQFSRYADIRTTGQMYDGGNNHRVSITADGDGSERKYGLGAYYADVYAKNEQILYLELGVPKFASLFSTLRRLIDRRELLMATNGTDTAAYDFGHAIGTGVAIVYFPVFWLASKILGIADKIIFGDADLSYYTVKPTMHTYWGSVNAILTEMAVELGLLSIKPNRVDNSRVGVPLTLDKEMVSALKKYYPAIISGDDDGVAYFDVFKLANSTLKNRLTELTIIKKLEELDNKSQLSDSQRDEIRSILNKTPTNSQYTDTFLSVFNSLFKDKYGVTNTQADPRQAKNSTPDTIEDISDTISNDDGTYKASSGEKDGGKTNNDFGIWLNDISKYMASDFGGGAKWLALTVEKTGSTTTTFSNSSSDIAITSAINGLSKGIQNARFSTAGGNILGDSITSLLSDIKNIGFGMLDGATLGLSNLVNGLISGGMVDFGKKWDGSSVSLPTHSFKLHMSKTSNHPLAKIMGDYLPIACLLAAALPKKVGNMSYTSPYIMSAFLAGVTNIRVGMIDSLTITAGTGNLARSRSGVPLDFEVEFSIVDLSALVAAPIPTSVNPINIRMSDSDPLSLYIRSITGSSLYREVSFTAGVSSRVNRILYGAKNLTGAAFLGSTITDTVGVSGAGSIQDEFIKQLYS